MRLTPDPVGVRFIGRQFRNQPELLGYEGQPFIEVEMLSVTMLHDVLVCAIGDGKKVNRLSVRGSS